MPEKKSLLKQYFGSDEFTPKIQEGIRLAKQERPDLAAVEGFGPISRNLMKGALAYATPTKSILLNAPALAGNPQDVADTLIHEQTHVDQMNSRPLWRNLLNLITPQDPYQQRSDELAAYQAERNRRKKMGRPETPIPSFETGEYFTPQDINLPTPTRSKK